MYRGGSGCESLWKQIEHQHITLVEQSAEHAPAELILNAREFRRPRFADPLTVASMASSAAGGEVEAPDSDEEEGGLLMKLSLPSSACSRELAQLLQGLSDSA